LALAVAPLPLSANNQLRRPKTIAWHVAHVGQEIEVHCRWHPLHGRLLAV